MPYKDRPIQTAHPDLELEALRKIAEALDNLPGEMRARILKWAANRYKVTIVSSLLT